MYGLYAYVTYSTLPTLCNMSIDLMRIMTNTNSEANKIRLLTKVRPNKSYENGKFGASIDNFIITYWNIFINVVLVWGFPGSPDTDLSTRLFFGTL